MDRLNLNNALLNIIILLFYFSVFVLWFYILGIESPIRCDSPKGSPADWNSADVYTQYTFYLDKITELLNLEVFFNTMTQIKHYIDCSLVTIKACYIAIHDVIGLIALCLKTIYIYLKLASVFLCTNMLSGVCFILSYPIMPDFFYVVFSEVYNAKVDTKVPAVVDRPKQEENPYIRVDLRGNISGLPGATSGPLSKQWVIFNTRSMIGIGLSTIWPTKTFSNTTHPFWGDRTSMFSLPGRQGGFHTRTHHMHYRYSDASASPVGRAGFWVRVPWFIPRNFILTSGGLPAHFRIEHIFRYMFIVADDAHTYSQYLSALHSNRARPMLTDPNAPRNTLNGIVNP